jgi:hypothetical protein
MRFAAVAEALAFAVIPTREDDPTVLAPSGACNLEASDFLLVEQPLHVGSISVQRKHRNREPGRERLGRRSGSAAARLRGCFNWVGDDGRVVGNVGDERVEQLACRTEGLRPPIAPRDALQLGPRLVVPLVGERRPEATVLGVHAAVDDWLAFAGKERVRSVLQREGLDRALHATKVGGEGNVAGTDVVRVLGGRTLRPGAV